MAQELDVVPEAQERAMTILGPEGAVAIRSTETGTFFEAGHMVNGAWHGVSPGQTWKEALDNAEVEVARRAKLGS